MIGISTIKKHKGQINKLFAIFNNDLDTYLRKLMLLDLIIDHEEEGFLEAVYLKLMESGHSVINEISKFQSSLTKQGK